MDFSNQADVYANLEDVGRDHEYYPDIGILS